MQRTLCLMPTLLLLACADLSTLEEGSVSTAASQLFVTGTLGPGSTTQLTSSTSSLNFKNVDESPCNGNSDYNVVRKGVGAVDTYEVDISSIPDTSLIYGIRVTPCASRDVVLASDSPTFEAFYSWNGVERRVSPRWKLKPQANPLPVPLPSFTLPALRSKDASLRLEVGVRVVTNPLDQGMRLSGLAVDVIYLENSSNSGGFAPIGEETCKADGECTPDEGCGCWECQDSC